jgi:hypothetical protein
MRGGCVTRLCTNFLYYSNCHNSILQLSDSCPIHGTISSQFSQHFVFVLSSMPNGLFTS